MSDKPAVSTKRGRKPNPDKAGEKGEKKRPRKDIKPTENGDEDGVAPPKRGRGRPKGSTKKKSGSPAKPKAKSSPGRRGRPKRDEKTRDSAEEDNEENDIVEDEDD